MANLVFSSHSSSETIGQVQWTSKAFLVAEIN